MIWSTGEAELETVRLRDDRIVNKHFDLTSRSNLDDLLSQLVRLLVQNEVPDAAVVRPDQPQSDGPPRTSSINGGLTGREITESRAAPYANLADARKIVKRSGMR